MEFQLSDTLSPDTPLITNRILSKATGMRDNVETFQISTKMDKDIAVARYLIRQVIDKKLFANSFKHDNVLV